MSDSSTTAPPSTGREPAKPSESAALYQLCLTNARQAESAGDVQTTLLWLNQAEHIGINILKQQSVPEVAATYVRLINRTCLKSRWLAVRSGSICPEHLRMAQEIKSLTEHLTMLLKGGKDEILVRAAVLEGYAGRLAQTVSTRRTEFGWRPAAVPMLDQFLDDLLEVTTQLKQLGIELPNPWGTSKEILSLIQEAVNNSRSYLSWFWPCDWTLSLFMCRRARQLLAQHLEGQGAPGSCPELERVLQQLKTAEAVLALHEYKKSSSALDLAARDLKAYAASH